MTGVSGRKWAEREFAFKHPKGKRELRLMLRCTCWRRWWLLWPGFLERPFSFEPPLVVLAKMSHFRTPAGSHVPQCCSLSLSLCFLRVVVPRRTSWKKLLDCSPSVLRWQIPSLPRGSTSRCRAVSTSSVKNSSSPANDVQAPRSPPSARVTSPLPDDIHACCDSASMLPVAFVRLSVEMFVLRNVISECFPCCAMERSRRLVPC